MTSGWSGGNVFSYKPALPCTAFVNNHPGFVHLWSQEKPGREKALCLISVLVDAIIHSNEMSLVMASQCLLILQ